MGLPSSFGPTLLLDEPFGALDARVRQDLWRWLDELHRELGVTSLLVTHDQEEALELANKVVVMHDGRVEQIGTPDAVYNDPATPFIAGFFGAANVIRGLVIDGRVQFGEDFVLGAEHLADGSAAHAYVRPHDVTISTTRPSSSSCAAIIDRRSDLGWVSKVHLRLVDGQRLIAQIRNSEIAGLHAGARVYVDLEKAKVFAPEGATIAESHELAAV